MPSILASRASPQFNLGLRARRTPVFRPVEHRTIAGVVADHLYQTQFAAIFRAGCGEDMPHTSLREALKFHRVLLAADHSARSGGQPVMLREFEEARS